MKKYTRAFVAICQAQSGYEEYFITNPLSPRKRQISASLKRHGIHNMDEFFADFLQHIRWRQQDLFKKLSDKLTRMTSTQRIAYIQSVTNIEHQQALYMVNEYFERLPRGGIAAHEYTWAVFKCWAGYRLGYVDYKQHMLYISDIVAAVQRDYPDWNSFLTGFFAGKAFFLSGEPSFEQLDLNKDVLSRLLESKFSPLKKVDLQG
ncbi:DUF1266 domain-containing protein [Paenibacillus radicis (ex Gao et al. 2016)]|uniref:DUF1266 domain-containing protein n=1 Tax=Paenibacillus radicis (ex Gao et al. 2016) TaxID=1737354 RepID=A0A917H2W9_9BACL|nr:DUF1266 domain-containing protein [Paenibacillus radicis (ex Gao et al. 2016)]GGG65506.1 hypothetical protein GCM10010918_19670 [Paenibacillus radicis (ex Gao et al. 2016)]